LTKTVLIATPAGTRRLAPGELPIRIGSDTSADIRLPGALTGTISALVSSLDDRPFLQVTAGTVAFAVNGEPVSATRWLADGDLITAGALRIECRFEADALRFTVSYADTEYATLPPLGAAPGTPPAAITPARPHPKPAPAGGARRVRWLVGGALALLAAAALHLFTARVVSVEVEPAGALLEMRGSWLAWNFGGSFLLRPGEYRLNLAAEGYEPQEQAVTVGEAPRQRLRFALRPLPGRLVIETTPPLTLALAIDGTPALAQADGSFIAPAGEHTLQMQRLAVQLQPDWADVAVTSEPAGATVALGEATLGTTPATVAVPTGSAEIVVRKDGYKPWRQSLTVKAGEQLELPLVRLQQADAVLSVASVPAGAAVTVDGRYRGVTPLELEVASGRAHTVLVSRPGYEPVTRSVSIERRGTGSVRVELAQRLGVVRVESEPPGALVLVNGEPRGPAPQELTLPALAQRIEVRQDGFVPFATEVTPRPGLAQQVRAVLLTPQQAVLAAIPKTLTTGQGAVLRLVEPGAFRMGAPRREQGRRPNESERAVRLTRHFYIGVREVTNREFREFNPRHTSGAEKYQELAGSDHPVVMLSWEEAARYCNWLSEREGLAPAYVTREGRFALADPPTTGYRMPTEAEWEWASRYNGGGGERRYPWGGQMPPGRGAGNYADQAAKGIVPNVLSAYNDGYPVTAPVGSFPASPLGLHDLGGNAAEWVSDFYTVYATAGSEEAVDPAGPATGQYHVIRGSSWRHASISELRFAYRDFGDQGRLDVGLRLARFAD